MREDLRRSLEKLERTKRQTLSLVEGLPSSVLNRKPQEGKWSIGQILFHMQQVEAVSLQYMRKKIENTTLVERTSVRENLRSLLLKVSLALPIKFKAPKVVSENIPDTVDYEMLKTSWEIIRIDLDHFVNNLPPEMLQHKIFRHPRVGLINIKQALVFYQSHFDHHLPQIKRLL